MPPQYVFIEDDVFQRHLFSQRKPSEKFIRLWDILKQSKSVAYVRTATYVKAKALFGHIKLLGISLPVTFSFSRVFSKTTRKAGHEHADNIIVESFDCTAKKSNHDSYKHKLKTLDDFIKEWEIHLGLNSSPSSLSDDFISQILLLKHDRKQIFSGSIILYLMSLWVLAFLDEAQESQQINFLSRLAEPVAKKATNWLGETIISTYTTTVNTIKSESERLSINNKSNSFLSKIEISPFNQIGKILRSGSTYTFSESKISVNFPFDNSSEIKDVETTGLQESKYQAINRTPTAESPGFLPQEDSSASSSTAFTATTSVTVIESPIPTAADLSVGPVVEIASVAVSNLAPESPTSTPSPTDVSSNAGFKGIEFKEPIPSTSVTPNPVTPNPVTPNPVTPNPVTPNPVTPNPVTPNPVAPNPVTPNPVTPNPVTPNPVAPNPVTPNPVTPNPVTPNPVTPNPVTPNPVTPNPVTTYRDASGGQIPISISQYSAHIRVSNFGGIGRGVNPSLQILEELDHLQFEGDIFSVDNIFFEQVNNDLLIKFYGLNQFSLVLENFNLEELDNIPFETGFIGNILFHGEEGFSDSFSVMNREAKVSRIFTENSLTVLNDLDNTVQGIKNSDDIIHGQGGNDYLIGQSGDDSLHGGTGDDLLEGNSGNNRLYGGLGSDSFILSLTKGIDTIVDFSIEEDHLVLPQNVQKEDIRIHTEVEDSGIENPVTYISLQQNNQVLARLLGIDASALIDTVFT
ncbi:MAG: hypothetical protein AAGI69_29345 [Cyanobacteria bacterium P01_H01_bin.21]